MILVDSSVIMDFLRAPQEKTLEVMEREGAAICGVTRAEVLHGARDEAHFGTLASALDDFQTVEIEERHWSSLGRNLWTLRRQGITVPFPDALIATVGISEKLAIWTSDSHFAAMAPVLPGLRLYQP